jgi:predicted aspartyl protease
MIRYSYNAQLSPPAPFVLITLRNPVSGDEAKDVPAQLDTAADRTLLPLAVVQALALPAIGSIPIGGVGGTVSIMTVYVVLLGVHTLPQRLIEVVAHPDESWVLLGRDVLNTHRLVLDGSQLALEIG